MFVPVRCKMHIEDDTNIFEVEMYDDEKDDSFFVSAPIYELYESLNEDDALPIKIYETSIEDYPSEQVKCGYKSVLCGVFSVVFNRKLEDLAAGWSEDWEEIE